MKFKTLYADPPWHFNDRLDPTRRKPYDTLSIDELMNLKIKFLMEKDAHCYLWSTSSHIHEALHLNEGMGVRLQDNHSLGEIYEKWKASLRDGSLL